MKKETAIYISIPKTPKKFLFEEVSLMMSIENIKDFAKDYGFTYTLDYMNAKVTFESKTNDKMD